MGCDGGSIPKRNEVVKKKEKVEKVDKEVQLIYKWGYCAASNEPLRRPIVSTHMGNLMNKEGAIEHLIEFKEKKTNALHIRKDLPGLDTFKSMKDIKELNLKSSSTDSDNGSDRPSTSNNGDMKWVNFVCPITNLEINGRYKFLFSWSCGCVISDRAFKEVSNENKCLVCQKPYRSYDIVVLNPETDQDVKHNLSHMETRLSKKSSKKRDKGQVDESSSSRVHHLTSTNHSTKLKYETRDVIDNKRHKSRDYDHRK